MRHIITCHSTTLRSAPIQSTPLHHISPHHNTPHNIPHKHSITQTRPLSYPTPHHSIIPPYSRHHTQIPTPHTPHIPSPLSPLPALSNPRGLQLMPASDMALFATSDLRLRRACLRKRSRWHMVVKK